MIEAFIAVLILRLVAPLYILKSPFWGFVLAILADAVDMELLKFFGGKLQEGFILDFGIYRYFDIFLDLYMSALAVWVSRRFAEGLVRKTVFGLFLWRIVGVIIFLLTQSRTAFFFFPNLFEFFFIFSAYIHRFKSDYRIGNVKKLALILFLMLIPKLAEEYILHVDMAQSWAHFKHDILGWPRSPSDF